MDLPWIKAFMESRRTEADKIQTEWSQELHRPSEDEIKRAALLAWEFLYAAMCFSVFCKALGDLIALRAL